MKTVIQTERLTLRYADPDRDAEFMLILLNDPSWIENIGDRGVRTLADARMYIAEKMSTDYRQSKYGMYLVELSDTQIPIGVCGLIKREGLDDIDIGFAFLPAYTGQGYAFESAAATMQHASDIGIDRVVGITTKDNLRSIRLLEKLGLRHKSTIKLGGDSDWVELYVPIT